MFSVQHFLLGTSEANNNDVYQDVCGRHVLRHAYNLVYSVRIVKFFSIARRARID